MPTFLQLESSSCGRRFREVSLVSCGCTGLGNRFALCRELSGGVLLRGRQLFGALRGAFRDWVRHRVVVRDCYDEHEHERVVKVVVTGSFGVFICKFETGAMGAGRGEVQESHKVVATAAENTRSGLLGFTLRQTVVLGLVAYAVITALYIAKNFISPKSITVTHNQNLQINVRGETAHALGNEEIMESVSNDDDIDSSGLRLGQVTHDSEDDHYYELRNSLYHSFVVFELNYEEMISKFKIFVYPSDERSFKVLSGPVAADDLRNTDDLFVHHLYQSDFVTLDPEKAHLLLLPLSIRGLVDDKYIGSQKVGKFVNKYIQSLRDDYPYWWRTLGADHIVVTCHEAREDGSRNVLELKKNAIQVACSPLAENGSQTFYPHKDVAMPRFVDAPLQPIADGGSERSTLAYYYGPTDSSSSYGSLGVSWESNSRFAFEAEDVEPAVHYKRLSTSKFCLILGPRDYPNIVNALRYGCVPVLVSYGRLLYDLPFQDILDWNRFAFVVSLKNVKKLSSLLSAFDEKQYITMQYLAKEASKHLEWHNPPQEQDAFYMVLYDLWIRRHAIRYVRRDEL